MACHVVTAELKSEQGFSRCVLRSAEGEVAVVPELGARVVSLFDRRLPHEWLWAPSRPARLFVNTPGDPFARGPLVGIDECIPTIGACEVNGRAHEDHGEAWSRAWTLDESAWERAIIATEISLLAGALHLRREISLERSTVRLAYRLTNRSPEVQPCLWALHPLLNWEAGDRIELCPAVTGVDVGAVRGVDAPVAGRWSWPQPGPGVNLAAGQLGSGGSGFAKLFAGPETGGVASLVSGRTGGRLTLRWDVRENPWLGLWLTTGGWNGYRHVALEPTTAPTDLLSEAWAAGTASAPGAGATRRWMVELTMAAA